MTESLQKKISYVAGCGEINPIERYYNREGYEYKCRGCGGKSIYKTLFLSPKGEVEGFFGPVYHCENCVPDLNQIATSAELFYGLIFGS